MQRHAAAARTPEELATQLEDAFILCDPRGLAELFDEHAVLSMRAPDIDVRGRSEIALFAAAQWTAEPRYLVSVHCVVQAGDTAAIVADWSPTDRRCLDGAEHDRSVDVLRAAGAGDAGFEAAAIIGERGHLISTDFSPAMMDVGRRRGAELGLGNVDYRVMDAQRIELDADSVDGVLCRFGYMLMADPAAAFAETRRVLRPGGRLALAVWGAPERNPWATIGFGLLIERGHMPPPEPGAPGPFAMASAEHTRALLEGAGITAVRTEEVPVRFSFRDIDDYTTYATDTGGPAALVLRGLPEDEREVLKTHLRAAFAPFGADARYEIPGVALCAAAD